VLAAAAGLAAGVRSSEAATYYSGLMPPNSNLWAVGWNYYTMNEAWNSDNPNGPLVRIMEHHTDGGWVNTYSARGYAEICHPRDYTETGCSNLESYTISLTCSRYVWPQQC
jgi:hypothetical protein